MKLLFFFFSFLLLPQPDSEKILWTEGQKLSWEDFKGAPVKSAGFVASTRTGIDFKYSYTLEGRAVKLDYTVASFFSPQDSWYFPEKVSQHVLNHEQTHFDISELHARILRKQLAQRSFTKNVKSEIESIFLKVESQRKEMQKTFDSETDHSRNFEKAKSWEAKIAQQLAKYEPWK